MSEDYPQDNANVARTIIIQDKIAANMARWNEEKDKKTTTKKTKRQNDKIAANLTRWIDEGAFKRETLYGISLLNEPAGWWDKVRLVQCLV